MFRRLLNNKPFMLVMFLLLSAALPLFAPARASAAVEKERVEFYWATYSSSKILISNESLVIKNSEGVEQSKLGDPILLGKSAQIGTGFHSLASAYGASYDLVPGRYTWEGATASGGVAVSGDFEVKSGSGDADAAQQFFIGQCIIKSPQIADISTLHDIYGNKITPATTRSTGINYLVIMRQAGAGYDAAAKTGDPGEAYT